jgi:RNA polymerase sigma-70 factor (ECF subfamily)
MATSDTDFDAVRRVQAGDRDAYADIVRRHHPRVISLCFSVLKNHTRAEDAAQDVFIKAYQALSSFRFDAQLSTWLYRIAYFHCLDMIRSAGREKTVSWEALLEAQGDRIQSALLSPNPATAEEQKDFVASLLSALSQEYRTVLVLREVEGLTYEEIAETMNCSLDSVKARLRRARREIQNQLRHFLDTTIV